MFFCHFNGGFIYYENKKLHQLWRRKIAKLSFASNFCCSQKRFDPGKLYRTCLAHAFSVVVGPDHWLVLVWSMFDMRQEGANWSLIGDREAQNWQKKIKKFFYYIYTYLENSRPINLSSRFAGWSPQLSRITGIMQRITAERSLSEFEKRIVVYRKWGK